jgi:hypothetical protein
MRGRRNPQLNWNQLLDGDTYTLNLVDIDWETSVNDLRAKAHYEADKRRGSVVTHKIDVETLELTGHGIASKATGRCTCGAKPWDFHVITCTSLGANAATVIGAARPQLQPRTQPQQPWISPAPVSAGQPLAPPAAEEPAATSNEDDWEPLTPEEELSLLGPCTCGQSPKCLPTCARFS